MNPAQKALRERLREIIEETPESGALNAGKKPLHVPYLKRAVEARAEDGDALVAYVRAKLYERPTSSYNALIEAGRPDLTLEGVAVDADAEWASEFTDAERAAAQDRLGTMVEAHREQRKAAEAKSVEHDRRIVAQLAVDRVAKGKSALSPEQEASILQSLATKRTGD